MEDGPDAGNAGSDGKVDELRRRKLEAKKAEEQLKAALRFALDEAACERMANVSLANKELYVAAARHLLAAFKRVGRKITDAEVLAMLRAIKEQTASETKITFHSK